MGRGATITNVVLITGPFVAFFGYNLCCGTIVDTRANATTALIEMCADQIELFHKEKGRYPSTEDGLAKVVTEGYLRAIPKDRWQNNLQYRYPSSRKEVPFELWSFGADGKPGGSGDDADIGNWKQ